MGISETQLDPTNGPGISRVTREKKGSLPIGAEEKSLSPISQTGPSLQEEAEHVEITSESVLTSQEPLSPSRKDVQTGEFYEQGIIREAKEKESEGIPEETSISEGLFIKPISEFNFEEIYFQKLDTLDEYDACLSSLSPQYPFEILDKVSKLQTEIMRLRNTQLNTDFEFEEFDKDFQEVKKQIDALNSIISFMEKLKIPPAEWSLAKASYDFYQKSLAEKSPGTLPEEPTFGILFSIWEKKFHLYENFLSQEKKNYPIDAQHEIERMQEVLELVQRKMSEVRNVEDLIPLIHHYQIIQEKMRGLYSLEKFSRELSSSDLVKLSAPWRYELEQYEIEAASLLKTVVPEAQKEIEALQKRIKEIKGESIHIRDNLQAFILSVEKIKNELDRIKAVTLFAKKLEIEPENWKRAEEIYTHYKTNWKDCYKIVRTDTGEEIYQQTHAIKHLKIYKDPISGILVADYGIKKIDAGTYKRIKKTARIGDEISYEVRLTSTAKDFTQLSSLAQGVDIQYMNEKFIDDVQVELDSRVRFKERLKRDCPYITQLVKVQYYNAKGILKTRYLVKYYPSNLWAECLRGDRVTNLHCCRDAVAALVDLHACKCIHCDVKTANILVDGAKGFLNDFGISREIGSEVPFERGASSYMAPEVCVYYRNKLSKCTSALDQFSVGIVLLEIVNPIRYRQWREHINTLEKPVLQLDRECYQMNQQKIVFVQKVKAASAALKTSQKLSEDEKIISEKKATLDALVKQESALHVKYWETTKKLEQAKHTFDEAYLKAVAQLQEDMKQKEAADPVCGIMKNLLDIDPEKRPSAAKVLQQLNDLLAFDF